MTDADPPRRLLVVVVAVSLVVAASTGLVGLATAADGSFTTETYDGREYKLYVPSDYGGGETPVVVMLHGCTQSPSDFAKGTKMNEVAEEEGFIVVYPDQTTSAHSNECWNWFDTAHQHRGSGEPALIKGMVDDVKANYNVDDSRVYVAGLSAGAAMADILGAAYPDVFAATAVHSGLEYKAATSESEAWNVMRNGGPDPDKQGEKAYNEMGSNARVVPTIVFHGTDDTTVYPVNGDQVAAQWAQTNDLASDGSDDDDIDATADRTVEGQAPGGRTYTRYVYNDSSGDSVVEKYMVDGMQHAWSGGDSAGSYTDPEGPDASHIIWEFFEANPRDQTAPNTTADPTGGTFSNPVSVNLSTDEPATIYYTLDGSTPTKNSTVYDGPVELTGNATLKFFSVDAAGNEESVQSETYTFDPDTAAPNTMADPGSGEYSQSVEVELLVSENATTYYTTDGSTPTTDSKVYDGPITLDNDTTLKFFSVDAAGNEESVRSRNYTIIEEVTKTFTSVGSEDGFDGRLLADGTSSSTQKIGDKGMGNSDTYRAILSFNTSDLPADAQIKDVTLTIYRKSMTGTVSSVDVDLKNGTFQNANVENGDYDASASATDVAVLDAPSSDGAHSTVTLPESAFEVVNRDGRTQIRLTRDGDGDYGDDVLELYGGEDSANAPRLNVTYLPPDEEGSNDTAPPETDAEPVGGTFNNSVDVHLTVNESATTYYTTDGSTPTTSSKQFDGSPITLDENATLKYFSVDDAGNEESVESETYDITDTLAPNTTADPAGGTYNDTVYVNLTVDENATTYYTTDGSNVTTNSTEYQMAIPIENNTTLKFFSVDTAGNVEETHTENYTIENDSGTTIETLLVDDFEDDDGLQDYDEDAHEGSPYQNNYFTDTTDSGGYDATPAEGSYDLGSYSDDGNSHDEVFTHSYDSGSEEPNTLPQPGDTITYYTQTDYLDGYSAYADAAAVRSRFYFGVQNASNKYAVEINMPNAASHADSIRLLKVEGGTVTELAAATSLGLNYKGNWYNVSVEWGTDGTITVTLRDHENGGTKVAELSATDDTFGAGGVGFWKTGGPSGGEYSLAYWDDVTVTRPV